MDLKDVVAVAKQRIEELFAADGPRDMRLEGFLYDDHLMVWSLTIGFAVANHAQESLVAARQARGCKVVRVSQADRSVLSVTDR